MKGWFYLTDRRGNRYLFYSDGKDRLYRPKFQEPGVTRRGLKDVSQSIRLVPVTMTALKGLRAFWVAKG